jgi:tripartite-type tricarboxylate transporter receptor subunit TctC
MPAYAGASTDYPDRPIQIYVPFGAGSASDVITRILLGRMATSLGQNFVVENRPGAGGNTGTAAAAHAAPDGYTLLMSTSGPLAANKALFKELGYDPQKDFAPICLFATLPNIVVINAKLPPKTLLDLIHYAKEHPKQLNYGSVGVGSSQHLAGAYFEQLTGTQLVHVPYRNIASYTPDFISGQVPVGFQLLPNVLGLIKSGDARALAVAGSKRMSALPDVPTAAEAGLQGELCVACVARARQHRQGSRREIVRRSTGCHERSESARTLRRARRRTDGPRSGRPQKIHGVGDFKMVRGHRKNGDCSDVVTTAKEQ